LLEKDGGIETLVDQRGEVVHKIEKVKNHCSK
jgi:hypothetical protein